MSERKGIPTMYDGVLMRSRTEARWAAMFDRLEWRWSYEPFDCKGWIPDFALHFPAGDMLAEIKATDEDFGAAEMKIDASAYEGPAVILGHNIASSAVGRIRDNSEGFWAWYQLNFFWCLSCGSHSVHAFDGDWSCRVCGNGYGNAHVGHCDIDGIWDEAGNRVQWQPEAA